MINVAVLQANFLCIKGPIVIECSDQYELVLRVSDQVRHNAIAWLLRVYLETSN